VVLVLDLERYSVESVRELLRTLTSGLEETADLGEHPRGSAVDPASLETARAWIAAALPVVRHRGSRAPGGPR
jgi:hypothetical protein